MPLRSFLSAVLVLLPMAVLAANPTYSEFNNGAVTDNVRWLDDRGELINAHDGGILYDHGIYYWYGMALRPLGLGHGGATGAATTTGIVGIVTVRAENFCM